MRTCHRIDERGFSLIEMLIVVAILSTVVAMSTMVSPAYMRYARAETSVAQTLDILRSARELAISQRRNIEVRFIAPATIETARIEVPSGVKTVLSTVMLENRVQFLLEPGVPDTPDLFGNATPVAFGLSPTRMFTSEGTFVDANGDVLNGSVFIAVPDEAGSAGAVTVFGTTAMLRSWRWDGTKWRN